MKDLTSTTFGLLIAFIIPGIICLFAVSYWIQPLQNLFVLFLTSDANVGLFFIVFFIGTALGLEISIIRSYIFKSWLCKSYQLSDDDFEGLHRSEYLTAFRASVDENLRYHQFWGGMVITIPILYLGWGINVSRENCAFSIAILICSTLVEAITILGAKKSYEYYVCRSKSILNKGGMKMPNGWEKHDQESEIGKSIPPPERPEPPSRPEPDHPTPPEPEKSPPSKE